jgi:translation initiation factor 4B
MIIDSSDQTLDQQNVPPQDQQQQPPQPELPKERPKLNLQPRTKPIETQEVNEKAQATIFGGAKPVDTAARERAIEEKLKSEVSKPQPATSTSEIKDDKSVHNDDNTDAKSTTTSIDQQNQQSHHQQHKSYRSDRSEHSGSDHKSQRNDQTFYSARGNKSRNHHQDHQNYETSDPSSPPQQQYYNDRNQQRSNYQQQQPRRQKYQQNDNNRQSANRSLNEERKYHQKVL